ncbi:MAG: DUF58 domain-containing protein [Bdellovibrionales bacterium]|nr:DUF58 domain-containing protein [Bdellovibrionales bacterium]
MLGSEQIRRIRAIEFTTRRLLDDLMSGGYRSSFKGQGVQFSEHRVYVPGDDVRHIDWKVSARTRDPLVKKYEEERELSVLLVVDASASLSFGSVKQTKAEVAADMAGMLAYAAAMNGDKVGLILFSNAVERIVPLKKGKAHVSRILSEIIEHRPKANKTNLREALDVAGRVMKHRGIVILLSDFIDQDYDVSLRRLARRHDVIAIHVSDKLESSVPATGFLRVLDPESGHEQVILTGSYLFNRWLGEFHKGHQTDTETAWRAGRVESLQIDTSSDPVDLLVRFFSARSRRRR